jgi:hypothetical protein
MNFLLSARALLDQAIQMDELVEPLWSRKEAAKFLGVSVQTKNMDKRGEAPPTIQVSRRRFLYRPSDCREFLRSRERKAPARIPAAPVEPDRESPVEWTLEALGRRALHAW